MYGPNTNTYESVDSATTPCFTVAYDANGNTLSDPSGKSYTGTSRTTDTGGGARHRNDDLQVRSLRQENPEVRPARNTNYLYDGQDISSNVIEELDSVGNVLARYTQGPA